MDKSITLLGFIKMFNNKNKHIAGRYLLIMPMNKRINNKLSEIKITLKNGNIYYSNGSFRVFINMDIYKKDPAIEILQEKYDESALLDIKTQKLHGYIHLVDIENIHMEFNENINKSVYHIDVHGFTQTKIEKIVNLMN